jgi:hypothetical protein
MTELLTSDTLLACSFGEAPAPFQALDLPGKMVIMGAFTTATIEEIAPEVNIPTFVMCSSMANPEVASATAAALGVLTPMPCVPLIAAPWDPPSGIMTYNGVPLATVSSKCLCSWGGEISVEEPIETIVTTT